MSGKKYKWVCGHPNCALPLVWRCEWIVWKALAQGEWGRWVWVWMYLVTPSEEPPLLLGLDPTVRYFNPMQRDLSLLGHPRSQGHSFSFQASEREERKKERQKETL
jgi:hypothetical protein